MRICPPTGHIPKRPNMSNTEPTGYMQNRFEQSGYEQDSRFLYAHHQPALLLELLLSRQLDANKALKGTGLFYDDFLSGNHRITPHQFSLLIKNAQQLLPDTDTSFRLGAKLWPGHYGEHSQLLTGSENLHDILNTLHTFRQRLSPLLVPYIRYDDQNCYVQWIDAIGLGDNTQFVLEAYMSGLTALLNWLSPVALPWRYYFVYSKPKQVADYDVSLGANLHFDCGINLMVIDKTFLNQPLTHSAPASTHAVLKKQCLNTAHTTQSGFIEAVYGYLVEQASASPSLESTARAFGMSSATFKRKLKKHHSQFQQLHDAARLHVSLYLFHVNGWTNERVAAYLHFNDATNFRRAFKRWSGFTPSESRARSLGQL